MIARLRGSTLLRQGSLVFGGILVSNIFNYLYFVIIGRIVGVESYGIIIALLATLLVVSAPASVAQIIVARIAAELERTAGRGALRRLSITASRRAAVYAALLVVLAVLARAPLAAFFRISDPNMIVAAAFATGLFSLTTVQRGVLQGAHRFTEFSLSMCVESMLKIFIALGLAVPFGAAGALAGVALGIVCSIVYNGWTFVRVFGPPAAAAPANRSQLMAVVTGVGAGQIAITVLSFYDVPVVKHVFDAHAAGLYAAASLVGRVVIGAIVFVPIVIMPRVAARVNTSASPLPLLLTALGVASAIVAVAVAAARIAPAFIVAALAGRAFAAAAPLVLPYVCAAGLLSLANVTIAYKIGLNRYDFVVPVLIVAVVEVLTVSLWHPSALAVVGTLIVGHGLVFVATLPGITAFAQARTDAEENMETISSAIATEGIL